MDLRGSEGRAEYLDEHEQGEYAYQEVSHVGHEKPMSKVGMAVMGVFLGLFAIELMLIVGIAWHRIVFGLYEQDLELFVLVLNEFGSSFFGGAALGAGGAVAIIKVIPTLMAKYHLSKGQRH